MASHFSNVILAFLLLASATTAPSYASLTTDYYAQVCPQALPVIGQMVLAAVQKERRMGASILRLHFHDCFVHVRSLAICTYFLFPFFIWVHVFISGDGEWHPYLP